MTNNAQNQSREYVVHVPVNFNDGTPAPTRYLTGILRSLAARFGGFTTYQVNGGWVMDDGSLVYEPMNRVVGAAPVNRATLRYFRNLAGDIAHVFQQEAVYLVTPQRGVEFVQPSATRTERFEEVV